MCVSHKLSFIYNWTQVINLILELNEAQHPIVLLSKSMKTLEYVLKPGLLFSNIVGSLYVWKIRFSRLFRGRNNRRCFCVELVKRGVKRLPVHWYSVDIFFSYSGPSGILGDSECGDMAFSP